MSNSVLSLWRGAIKLRTPMSQIAAEVADMYGVTVEDIRGPSRRQREAEPRRHAVWLMSQQPHVSMAMIGRYMGGRDRTTIEHHCERYQAILETQALEVAA